MNCQGQAARRVTACEPALPIPMDSIIYGFLGAFKLIFTHKS